MEPKKPLPKCLCSFCVSVFCLVSGVILIFAGPLIFNHIVNSNLVLTPSSPAFQIWKKFPVPLEIDFYFFNWTNPQEINNASSKPRLQQVGPYRYFETKEKVNITWNENGTVTFKQLRYWHFDDRDGTSNHHDLITTLNPVSVSAAYTTRDWSFIVKAGLSMTLGTVFRNLYVQRPVNQMLFEGYQDTLISLSKSIPLLDRKSLPPWDKFAWFYTRNGSIDYDGVYNMGTGVDNEFGKLYNWNYKPKTSFYEGECGAVRGSAGEFFPAHPPKTYIEFFSPDMCRSVKLEYVGEDIVNGILGNKYAIVDMFDNGTKIPGNECYCNGECVPSGVLNVSTCRFGAPGFASLPHFFKADPYYLDLVDGLQPDEKKHDFFITLEPTTGIPLDVNVKLQINLLMQPMGSIPLFQNVPRVFFPMLWFEQKVRIPDEETFKLKMLLNLPVILASIGIVLICASLVLMSCALYKLCTTRMCGKPSKNNYFKEQEVPLRAGHITEMVKKS